MSRTKHPELREGKPRKAVAKPAVEFVWEGPPEPPASITNVELWNEIWNFGGEGGAYDRVGDFQAIKRYVELNQRRDELNEILIREGYIAEGSQGQDVAHPAAKLINDCEAKLSQLEDKLGLNPTSRLSLVMTANRAASTETPEAPPTLDNFLDE